MQAEQSANLDAVLEVLLAHGAFKVNVSLVVVLSDFKLTAGQVIEILGGEHWRAAVRAMVQFLLLKKLFLLSDPRDKLALDHFLMDGVCNRVIC